MIVIDARDLEPPEPFERVMEALSDLKPGHQIKLILNREPHPLYRVLERNGYAYEQTWFNDGRCEILIWEKLPRRNSPSR
jgi:tRNA 2-thiouridine synthesizing protein A